jgi:hypothetical protein
MRKSLLCFCLLSVLVWGQSYTGSIRGTVTDTTKAAVPGAKITAIDTDRNVEYSTLADSSGRYILPTLPAASYALTVQAAGFQKGSQPAFRLEVQQQATVDIELSVGAVTTTVEVQASSPLLNTTSATLGQVVESRLFLSAPNQGRNPLSLLSVAPGVVPTGSGTNFVSSGVRNNASEVLMDGVPLTGIEQNGGVTDVKYTPTIDVVDEFKIQTNFFSAEFGNSGGTVINMVSKSGTNQVHGVGYFFRRDNALNANNWFSNARGVTLPDLTRNNFGGTVGGPVYLPKIYNGKNRSFFFADYDRFRQSSATTALGSVPTAQQLAGDFSDTRLNNGALVPLFDPYSTFTDASGTVLRNPIPGNVIPLSRQDAITRNFIKYFPAPNLPGDPFTRNNNWFAQGSNAGAGNKLDAKLDHNVSEKQRFTARYSVDWGWSTVANLTGNISHNGNPGASRSQNFTVDYTRTHSPTTIINLRAGVLRVRSLRDPLSSGFDATTLGLPKEMIDATGVKAFPLFSAQYRSMGAGGYAIIHRYEDVYQYLGALTRIHGGHTIKAGAEFRKLHLNYFQPNTPNGGFTFTRGVTSQNPTVSSSTQGDGLASALLGWGSSGQVSIDYPTAQSAGYFGTYVNDDWRITRKLTLNLGLRYDFDIPRTDRFNRINWLDLDAPAPIANVPAIKAVFPNLKGLMRFADDKKRTPYDGDWNNVQPRIGFAYALTNKTSIRAAYGLFYVVSRHTVKGEVGTAFGFTDSSIPWTLDSGLTRYARFSNPWPDGLTYPPGRDPLRFLGLGAGTPLPKDDNPPYQQWTFSIQREIPGRGVLEVNYVGTKGTHLYFGQGDVVSNLNPLDPIYWSQGRGTSGNGLNALVPNPFYGVITNPTATNYNRTTIQLNRLLRPYPEYSGSVGGYRASRNIGNSIYHALQVKYEKRFSHGLSMIAHYTFSKMISDSDVSGSDVDWLAGGSTVQDLKNLRNERSIAVFDRPHRLVTTFDYQIPIGRKRALGKSMNRILDGVIGGWELSGIVTASSGTPLGISQSASNLWQGNQRPNLVGDPSKPGSVRDKLNNYLNVAAFQQVNPDLIGSTPRFLPKYRGPGTVNEDATLMKNFAITESKYLQLRLEAYSVMNSPQWGMPGTSFAPGSSSFGQITSSGGNRSVQIAAKFYY